MLYAVCSRLVASLAMLVFSPLRTDFASFLSDVPAINAEIQTCLESIEDAREHIRQLERRIGELKRHIHALGGFRNAFLPISSLPAEVLQEIFLKLARSSRSEKSSVFPEMDMPLRRQSWIRITLVCKLWRRLAISCPALWTHLACPAKLPRDMTEQLYLRSRTLPLNVRILDGYANEIFRHQHRVQHLHELYIPPHGYLSTRLEAVLGLGVDRLDMPILQSLHVNAARESTESDCSPLIRARIPQLKYLSCDAVPWSLIASLGSQSSLVCLMVNPGLLRLTYSTMAQWLDVLENQPSLQELRLTDVYFREYGALPSDSRISSRQVQLPHLKHISLAMEGHFADNEYLPNLPHLLTYLAFPADAKVNLTWENWPGFRINYELEPMWHSWMTSVAQRGTTALDPLTVVYQSPQIVTADISFRFPDKARPFIQLTGWDKNLNVLLSIEFMEHGSTEVYEEAVVHSFLASSLLSDVPELSLSNIMVTDSMWSSLTVSSPTHIAYLYICTVNTFLAFLLAFEASLEEENSDLLPHLLSLTIVAHVPRLSDAPLPTPSRSNETQGGKGLLQRLVDALVVRRRRGMGPMSVDTGSGPQDVDQALSAPVPVDMWIFGMPMDSSDGEGMFGNLFEV